MDELAKEYIEALKALPQEIRMVSLELLELEKGRASLGRSLTLLEMEIAVAVASAKGEDGKATFTNDLTRKAEVARRLSQDVKAANIRDSEQSMKAGIDKAKIELAFLENRYSSARHILDYLTACKTAGGP